MQAKLFAPVAARRFGVYAIHSETITHRRCRLISWVKPGTALAVCVLLAAAANAQVRPGAATPDQKAGYAVDGRALGSRVTSDRATRDYKCGPSEQFSGFTWCQKSSRERERRGGYDAISSMLHAKDGTVVYVNRHQQPAYLDAAEVESSIAKYTRQFGAPAKVDKLQRRGGAGEATLATWGKLELEPLDADSIKLLADGKSPKKGFLLDYLGNLSRSAQEGLPIFRIRGGAGFAWAASFDAKGRGTLRLLALDASALPGEPATATPPASAAADEPQPAYRTAAAGRQEPVAAPRGREAAGGQMPGNDVRGGNARGGAADDTIARLNSELSLLREQKAQAEETARMAAADAAIARNEKEEATHAEEAASRELARLQQALVAPSLFADRETAVPAGLAAIAILYFGVWLGGRASRWRARRAAAGDVDTPVEHVEGVSDQPPAATGEATPAIDQEGLVRELGKQLGLEEVTAPPMVILLPDNSAEPAPSRQEPASQQEPVALPVPAAI